jgi:hypothetical protein
VKRKALAAAAYMVTHRKQLVAAVGFGAGLLDAIQRAS